MVCRGNGPYDGKHRAPGNNSAILGWCGASLARPPRTPCRVIPPPDDTISVDLRRAHEYGTALCLAPSGPGSKLGMYTLQKIYVLLYTFPPFISLYVLFGKCILYSYFDFFLSILRDRCRCALLTVAHCPHRYEVQQVCRAFLHGLNVCEVIQAHIVHH